jgi:hypothetical protein
MAELVRDVSPPAARRDLRLVHRGFDTADLRAAKALLDELSDPSDL